MSADKAKAALAAVSEELQTLRAQQEAKRTRLGEIDAQVVALRAAPLSLEDFQGYLAKVVAERGREYGQGIWFREWVRPNRQTGHDFHVPAFEKPWSQFEDEDGNPVASAIIFPDRSILWKSGGFDALCFFAPEMVTEKLAAQLQSEVGSKWGVSAAPPVAERRVLIARLEEEREAVEDELQSVAQSIAEITGTLNLK